MQSTEYRVLGVGVVDARAWRAQPRYPVSKACSGNRAEASLECVGNRRPEAGMQHPGTLYDSIWYVACSTQDKVYSMYFMAYII